ncbi:MAG: hypothetical protein ACI4IE_08160 [Eubacterium sp.]
MSESEFKVLLIIISVSAVFRAMCFLAIYFDGSAREVNGKNKYCALTLLIPVITGIFYLGKRKKYELKNNDINTRYDRISASNALGGAVFFGLLTVLIAGSFAAASMLAQYNHYFCYDSRGNLHSSESKMIFYDSDGGEYKYNFDRYGYDYLFDETGKKYNSDYCYVDEIGNFYYDENHTVMIRNIYCCLDENGDIYYPVSDVKFKRNGEIKCEMFDGSFIYDRNKQPYISTYAPYFDKQGNRYFYSFDSDTQKGVFTRDSDGKTFDNKYSFVDENGYFVYDADHSFTKENDITYKDEKGTKYYWASGVSWDSQGNMLDNYGNSVKN